MCVSGCRNIGIGVCVQCETSKIASELRVNSTRFGVVCPELTPAARSAISPRSRSIVLWIAALAACSCGNSHMIAGDDAQPAEDCSTPGDEDGNGLADCRDPVCANLPSCQPVCGNSIVDPGEQCDDGNHVDGDTCESDCTLPVCGNGIVDPGEQCDDGNLVDRDGCSRHCTSPVFSYLKASNTSETDQFGYSIALSADGSTLVVGAALEDSASPGIGGNQASDAAPDSGAVYVFVRAGAAWRQQAYIKASNPRGNDQFGTSVALSADGSTLAVGAIGESSSATGIGGNQTDNAAPGSGAVYVFVRTAVSWSQQAYVKASNTRLGDGFGTSVTVSADGSILAVGAIGEDSAATGVGGNQADGAAPDAGAVYLFTRSGTTWSQQVYLKASNTGAGDAFGWRVALSADGSTLAAAAVVEDSAATGIDGNQADNSALSAGAVYVFIHGAALWSQQAYIKASNTAQADNFGTSMALSADGSTLAVGALGEDSGATGVGGNQASNSIPESGAAYVFVRAGTTWSQQAYIKASNTGGGDELGWSVALTANGDTVAVGAVLEDSAATGISGDQASNAAVGSGAVYVFGRSGTVWQQQTYIKATNTEAGDQFGTSVALSGDGSSLAVGALGESSAATGVDGNQGDDTASEAGAVYVFR